MTALAEFLFPAPAKRTVGSILKWWESRRLPYNLFVGGAGLISLGWVYTLAALIPPSGASMGLPWLPVLIFAAMANVCYTLGPVIEIIIEKLFGSTVLPTGPVLYRMGLTFSMGLAIFPALIFTIAWVAKIVFGLF